MYLLIDMVSCFIEMFLGFEINLFHDLYHFHSIKNGIKQIIDDLTSLSSILKDKLDNDINSIISNMEVLSQSTPDLKETIENLK